MKHVFVIAEAGVNHNGSLDLALQLLDAAKACGADAVKFQTFRAELLATRSARKAPYQDRTTSTSESQFEMLQRLQLGADDHRTLIQHCREIGIQFLSSPFDTESADLLDELGVPLYKVPSGEITNLPFLRHLAHKKKPLIVSTGMSTLGEVEEAVQVLQDEAANRITLLHCVTEYPAPFDEVNLRAMLTLKAAFGLPVGYSDHTAGIEVAVAAVALGAEVIEKHLTMDRSLSGPDHHASLEPNEFEKMVAAIRHVESALGTGIKSPAPCELQNLPVARKSVVSSRALRVGHRIVRDDLEIKRPGNGLAPKFLPALIGLTLRTSVDRDEVLTWNHFA
ncbi:N-acetylneuraminate synthase [Telmatobacter sp. DSM 110680]|uniref:N-acetylneuraminate synthase n=1 Tax=Telmatobacter sp. DSM 110680 TaxID=3036704 RepID=A0AAU7DE01_9BACT